MIRPQPDSFGALMHELLVERYNTTDRDRPNGFAAVDTPEAFEERRRVLNEAMADENGSVIPMVLRDRRPRRAA